MLATIVILVMIVVAVAGWELFLGSFSRPVEERRARPKRRRARR